MSIRPLSVSHNSLVSSPLLHINNNNSFRSLSSSSLKVSATEEVGNSEKPSTLLPLAYSVTGLATALAWAFIVLTTITSNAPLGALMPNWQHPTVNQISVLSALPLILSSFNSLRVAASSTWKELSSPSCRRHNLALAASTLGGALWVNYAHIITKVPGTALSHASYAGPVRAALLATYLSTAALSAAVWARSVGGGLSSLPTRLSDGVSRFLCALAPADKEDPVNVKYSVLTAGFTFLTALQLLAPHPLAVVPSWTGRRISRAFAQWTLLAAVTSYDLKEAVERGELGTSRHFQKLSNGLKAFGVLHVLSKIGAVFLDPSFPGSYHAVVLVPGWAAAATALFCLTLRSDKK